MCKYCAITGPAAQIKFFKKFKAGARGFCSYPRLLAISLPKADNVALDSVVLVFNLNGEL